MSIVPESPDSNDPPAENTLRGIGQMMARSPIRVTAETGLLLQTIGHDHEPPVTCSICRDEDRDASYPCLMLDSAMGIAFAWLLDWATEDR